MIWYKLVMLTERAHYAFSLTSGTYKSRYQATCSWKMNSLFENYSIYSICLFYPSVKELKRVLIKEYEPSKLNCSQVERKVLITSTSSSYLQTYFQKPFVQSSIQHLSFQFLLYAQPRLLMPEIIKRRPFPSAKWESWEIRTHMWARLLS